MSFNPNIFEVKPSVRTVTPSHMIILPDSSFWQKQYCNDSVLEGESIVFQWMLSYELWYYVVHVKSS